MLYNAQEEARARYSGHTPIALQDPYTSRFIQLIDEEEEALLSNMVGSNYLTDTGGVLA